jgi:hypothetical protein
MSSQILHGTGELVDQWLGLNDDWEGTPPRYRHRATLLRLLKEPPKGLDGFSLIRNIFKKINANWRDANVTRLPSRQNWRFEKRLTHAANNSSAETTLERAISRIADDGLVNQTPTCSGLINDGGRRCNIDLTWRDGKAFTFCELKVETNNPLYAAIEILQYGLIYVFSRKYMKKFEYQVEEKPSLGAEHVSLRVLAPIEFYADYQLKWLENAISDGLKQFSRDLGYGMDFQYEHFPKNFIWQCSDSCLKKAFNGRKRCDWSR